MNFRVFETLFDSENEELKNGFNYIKLFTYISDNIRISFLWVEFVSFVVAPMRIYTVITLFP